LASFQFKDPVDGTVLLEIRGTKTDGTLGMQSMVPPSVWSKEGNREPLEFRAQGDPTHLTDVKYFKERCYLAAIAMLLAKTLGQNGFGHEPRLCWAGYLLRKGVSIEDLVLMGDAISIYCNNREIHDVRRVVESTAASLVAKEKHIKGGTSLARLIGGDTGKKVISAINMWLGRDTNFVRADGKIIKDHQGNIRRAVELLGAELYYQEFSERMLVREQEGPLRTLDDRVLSSLWLRVDREYQFRPSFVFFEKVVTDSAYENSFHPVRDYLRSLTWDGTPRIHQWLVRYGGATDIYDQPEKKTYLKTISAIVLIAAVRRVMHPGCKYDEMLVLESAQGLNKSSALRALCPYDEWFSDDLPLNCDAKEIIERTLGKWIIEASDLVGGRKADRDHLKSMLSRQIDGPARMAYAHQPVERPRQFIIIGTTNSSEYLVDPSGARRFWPVQVQKFDIDGLLRDRDQLWAEAVVRESDSVPIRLPEILWPDATRQQEKRREIDPWEAPIRQALFKIDPASDGKRRIATEDLWAAVGLTNVERRDRPGGSRIAEIMHRFGFQRTTVRNGNVIHAGYITHREDLLDMPEDTRSPGEDDDPTPPEGSVPF
jgi:predicted P-loop ATPase